MHLRHVMGSTIGMLMTLRGRYLPPASCRVSSCLAAQCDECDFTKVAPSQVADSQFACSLKLELQLALLRMCQSPPFTYTCNSARKSCDGGTHRGVCTAEVDACELPVAEAVQGSRGRGVSNLSSETAEKRQKTFMATVVHRYGNKKPYRYGCLFSGSVGWSKVMLAHKPAAVRRSERLVATLAPPSVPARLVRCAGHC